MRVIGNINPEQNSNFASLREVFLSALAGAPVNEANKSTICYGWVRTFISLSPALENGF
jgi:hypothetical protein